MVNDFIKLVQKWKVQNDDEEESDESLSFCSRLTFIGTYKLNFSTTKLVVFSFELFIVCSLYTSGGSNGTSSGFVSPRAKWGKVLQVTS